MREYSIRAVKDKDDTRNCYGSPSNYSYYKRVDMVFSAVDPQLLKGAPPRVGYLEKIA